MKSMMQTKQWLTVLAAASVLSLTACGGGGRGSDAAATPSSTGGNGTGTVGTGTGGTGTPVTPAVVPVQGQKLAAGVGYSLGVTSAGNVLSWGAGMHGTVPTGSTVAAVGTASWGTNLNASWAVTSAGDLLYWGDDAAGKPTANAAVLSGLGHVAAARACGSGNGAMLYVLKVDGSVWAVPARDLTDTTKGFAVTGVGQAKALGDGTDATCSSMLAIEKENGRVWQLQANKPGDSSGVPTQAQGVIVAGLSGVTQTACSSSNCLAVTGAGVVLAWGTNDKGQLGDLTLVPRMEPAPVDIPKSDPIRQVLMTVSGAVYAISAQNTLYGWGQLDGWKSAASLDFPGTHATQLLGSGVLDLSVSPASGGHTLVLVRDEVDSVDKVFGWGQNGAAEVVSPASTTPLIVPTDTGFKLQ